MRTHTMHAQSLLKAEKQMKITDYEIIDHGVENEQYFQGCGVCFTKFEHISTGIGSSACLALEDALECACDVDCSSVVNDLSNVVTVSDDAENCYHYVSIRYNVA